MIEVRACGAVVSGSLDLQATICELRLILGIVLGSEEHRIEAISTSSETDNPEILVPFSFKLS